MSQIAVAKTTCYVIVNSKIRYSTGGTWTNVFSPRGTITAIAADDGLLCAWTSDGVFKKVLHSNGKPKQGWQPINYDP